MSLPFPISRFFLPRPLSVVTKCTVCALGYDPFTFLSCPFPWVGVLWPQLSSVKICALGPPRPLSPSVPAVAGRQLVIVRAAAYASDSGESLHCFLVGANKSYVIDLIRLSGFCVSHDTHEVGWRARWRVHLRAERAETTLFKPEQSLEHPKQGTKLVKKFVKSTSTH